MSFLDSAIPGARIQRWWWLPEALLLAAFVVLVLASRTEGEQFLGFLRRARPGWLGAAAVLQLATYACDGALWRRVLVEARVRTSLAGVARLSVMKLTLDQLVPTAGIGGSVLVARGLRAAGAAAPVATAAVLLTIVCSYAGQACCLVIAGVSLWSRHELDAWVRWTITAFAVVATAVPVAILLLASNRRSLLRWSGHVRHFSVLLRTISEAPPTLVRNVRLIADGTLLQVAIVVLDATTLWTLLAAVGEAATFDSVFVCYVIASAVQVVSVIPGGVGTFEAASVAMLALLGIPVAVAVTATLLFRGFTLWLPLVPGFYLLQRSLWARAEGNPVPEASRPRVDR